MAAARSLRKKCSAERDRKARRWERAASMAGQKADVRLGLLMGCPPSGLLSCCQTVQCVSAQTRRCLHLEVGWVGGGSWPGVSNAWPGLRHPHRACRMLPVLAASQPVPSRCCRAAHPCMTRHGLAEPGHIHSPAPTFKLVRHSQLVVVGNIQLRQRLFLFQRHPALEQTLLLRRLRQRMQTSGRCRGLHASAHPLGRCPSQAAQILNLPGTYQRAYVKSRPVRSALQAACMQCQRLGSALAMASPQGQPAAAPAHLLQQLLQLALNLRHSVCPITVKEDSLHRRGQGRGPGLRLVLGR